MQLFTVHNKPMWPNPDVLAYVEVGVAGPESRGKTADREAVRNAVYLAKLLTLHAG